MYKNKIIIITGATSGIGKELAKNLDKEHATLILTGSSAKKIKNLKNEFSNEHLIVKADLTKKEEVKKFIKNVLKKYGRIDIFVASAGLYEPSEIKKGDPDKWDKVIQLNVNSVFRSINLILPSMIKNKVGDIVIISSVSGHQAIRWEPIYSATKHAIQSFAHGLRTQVAKDNIRVISIAPGIVLTELWGFDPIKDSKKINKQISKGDVLGVLDVVESIMFTLSRPRNVTIRDLVILPRNQDI
jgi:ribitol 2-dehydrogenase